MESGTVLGGRYELTEPVGVGGVGEVWRATDGLLDRPVAVKVLRPELAADEHTVRRFAAEARIMARLNHPGIAAVYDFGKDPDGTAYLVMRFVSGESLRAILSRDGTVPPARAMELVAEAAEALDAAHAAGVIHRDVKPGNLMVRVDGSVVLTDFGIARAAGNDNTGAGLVLGTARYLAPEQAAGEEITPAVDVYALGVTTYECLTGQPPFDGANPVAVAMRHIEDTPPPLPRNLPEPVRTLVSAMMSKDPTRRPTATAVALAARRAEILTDVPLPTVDRRRGRILAGVAAGVTAVLAAFTITALGTPSRPAGSSASGRDGVPIGSGIGMTEPPRTPSTMDPVAPPVILPSASVPGHVSTTGPAAPRPPTVRPLPPPGGTSPGRPPTAAPTSPAVPTTEPPPPTTPPPPQPVAVPDVVGMTQVDATTALEAAGFDVDVSTVDGPACAVVDQTPDGGELVPPGSSVSIVFEGAPEGCPL